MPAPTSTFGLIERARTGDRDAFESLFSKYRRRLAVLIHYKLRPEMRRFADEDDILQETLLRAFSALDEFDYRGPGSFLAWSSRIAGNVLADMDRTHRRARRDDAGDAPLDEVNPADSRTPSRVLAQKQAVNALVRRLDDLPADYRSVILMAKFERLTTAEMAGRLGRSREAVAVLLHRALIRYSELLKRKPS